MKKLKRILALAGAILLALMYLSTLILAFVDKSADRGMLKASIACTILVPVLLYAFTLVYKLVHRNDHDGDGGEANS